MLAKSRAIQKNIMIWSQPCSLTTSINKNNDSNNNNNDHNDNEGLDSTITEEMRIVN